MKSQTKTTRPPALITPKADAKHVFKTCPVCRKQWMSRDDFLSDPQIKLLGYQVDFDELTLGIILFNHEVCFDTLGVRVADFADLQSGPIFSEKKNGSEDCPGYCLHECNLNRCPAKCECAWVREVLQRLSRWPKRRVSSIASA